ncbi:MAG: hypothetical protein D6675_04675 [Gemmatimonadetes bacterium]|nr:MAG: hypothetical protein D6675_04675 [Gemmatimonadota bacterium]
MNLKVIKLYEQYIRNAQGEIEFVVLPYSIYLQLVDQIENKQVSNEAPSPAFTLDDALKYTDDK